VSVNPSIGLLAVRQVAALVGAAGSPAPVARTDQTEYTEDRLPAYNVFRAKDHFAYKGARSAANAEFDVIIRAMVKATSESDEAADPLIVWAWQQVMTDCTLGRIVSEAKVTDVEYVYLSKGEYDVLAADITVSITVDVGRSDPTQNLTYGG